jgi:hypothetical protein
MRIVNISGLSVDVVFERKKSHTSLTTSTDKPEILTMRIHQPTLEQGVPASMEIRTAIAATKNVSDFIRNLGKSHSAAGSFEEGPKITLARARDDDDDDEEEDEEEESDTSPPPSPTTVSPAATESAATAAATAEEEAAAAASPAAAVAAQEPTTAPPAAAAAAAQEPTTAPPAAAAAV